MRSVLLALTLLCGCDSYLLGGARVPDHTRLSDAAIGRPDGSSGSTAQPDQRATAVTDAGRLADQPTAPKPDMGKPPSGPTIWQPKTGTSWQVQYTGQIDLSLAVQVFNLDLFDVTATTIVALKSKGIAVVCYFSAGSHENWRPDEKSFPAAGVGNALDGWEGERWLDHRAQAVRAVMLKRLDLAKSKGCDAVDPDNVDGYTHDTGFVLTAKDQIAYNVFLATEAHKRGLAIGLKNDLAQVAELHPHFDFAVNEQCHSLNECQYLAPFFAAGKAVFNIEYAGNPSTLCAKAKAQGLSTLIKKQVLDAWRQACP